MSKRVKSTNGIELDSETTVTVVSDSSTNITSGGSIVVNSTTSDVDVDATTNVTIDSGDAITMNAGSNVDIDGTTNVTIDSGGNTTVTAGAALDLNSTTTSRLDAGSTITFSANTTDTLVMNDTKLDYKLPSQIARYTTAGRPAASAGIGSIIYDTDLENLLQSDGSVWTQIATSAAQVSYSNSTSGLTASDAQAAIDEVEGRVDTLESASTEPSDGDKGDITVSSSGTIWSIDNDVIGTEHLADADWGDFTITTGVATIDNNAVTYSKIQDVSATERLLGRHSASAGDIEEISLGSGLSLSSGTLSASSDILGTDRTLPSATSDSFTGLPSGLNEIVVMIEGVIMSADQLQIRIGDSDGIETANYSSSAAAFGGSGINVGDGFTLTNSTPSTTGMSGIITLSRKTGNQWTLTSVLRGDSFIQWAAGVKTLSGEITQIQLRSTGLANFSAGSWNIRYH